MQDVLMECGLQAGGNFDTYKSHCMYATYIYKAKECCKYCCTQMSRDEILEYGKSGRQRCLDSNSFCEIESIEKVCPEAETYAIYLAAAKQLIEEAYPDIEYPEMVHPWETTGFTSNLGVGLGEVPIIGMG